MILLLYFVLLLIFNLKSKSIALLFILLQIISLLGISLIGLEYPIDSFFKVFNLGITAIILTLIISPWRTFKKIEEIDFINENKLKKLTHFLLIVSSFSFIILSATTVFVMVFVDDINTFKYAEGVSTDFYYNLPFNVKALILSTYLYYFSYFLIPLHFYYLAKGNYWLSLFCFILSLNIILYGLTYFSRSVFAHYSLIYVSFLIILYNTLSEKIKYFIKKAIIITAILFSFYFIYITNQRFTKDVDYANTIPSNSIIQDPVLYSYFDYLSQWYYNSMYVLNSYNYHTFNGQVSLQPVLSLLGQYGFIEYNTNNYMILRQTLWPKHWYTFNGFVAYTIFDMGYFLSLLFSLAYYFIINKLKPRDGHISLVNLFFLILFIQLPLMAIFYSTVGGIIIPFLLLLPIIFYLKTRVGI